VSAPERGLGLVGRSAAGEDEAEILGALGQRHDPLAPVHRNGDVLDAGHRARLIEAFDALQDAAVRDGNHHDAGGGTLALQGRDGPAQSMAQDDLLERHARAEAQGPRAQPADGARGQLDEPGTRVVDAQLGVHGAVGEAEGPPGPRGAAAGPSSTPKAAKPGWGTPARASTSRIASLFRVARTAAMGFARSPRACPMAAPTTVVASSTGTTAAMGYRRA